MPMDWRTAYLEQAPSDYKTLQRLLEAEDVPLCQCLHYLQMATEKLAKGFLTRPGGDRYPNVHDAFVRFVRVARGMPELQRACGFTRRRAFAEYLGSLHDLAQAVEDLSPEDGDHPNPEYPWEQAGNVVSPLEYGFPSLDLYTQSPKMVKLLTFIERCFTVT